MSHNTQLTPHTSEINVDLLQHNRASTTPHQHSINTEVKTVGLRSRFTPSHPQQFEVSYVSRVVAQRQQIGLLCLCKHQSLGELLSRSSCSQVTGFGPFNLPTCASLPLRRDHALIKESLVSMWQVCRLIAVQWFSVFVLLHSLSAHAQRGLYCHHFVCLSVCLFALQATRQLMSDTNSFSGTGAREIKW